MAEQQQQMSEEQLKALQEKIKQMSPGELKEFQKKQCIFCQIISGKVQSKKVFEDGTTIGILDINPANPGHILLMPKEHYTIMPQIPEDEIAHLFLVSKALSNAMLRALEVQGTNIIVANGVAAGQRAQHFMAHIIPRKDKDGLKFELPQKEIQLEELEEIRKKLVENLGSRLEEKEMPRQFAMPKKVVEAEFKEQKKADEKKVPLREKTVKKSQIKNKKTGEKVPIEKKQPIKKTQSKKEKPIKKIKEKKEAKEDASLDDIAKLLGAK